MNHDDELSQYRQHLILAEQKAIEDYDKTVLTLSGGAIGVSFAFVTDVVGSGPFAFPLGLFLAWLAWGLSVTIVLASLFASHLALRTAIQQVDSGTIYLRRPGGPYALITNICNVSGGLLFLVGVLLMGLFVYCNLGE
jgi:hypothetical protein